MMMERAKTAPAPEEATDNIKSTTTTKTTALSLQDDASPEQRVQDLERRLNNLGGDDSAANVAGNASAPTKQQQPSAASQTGKNNPLLKRIQAAQERARQAEQKEKLAKQAAEAEKQRKLDEQRQLEQLEQERIQKAQSTLRSAAANALEDKSRSIMAQLEGKVDPTTTTTTQQQQPEAGVPIMKSLDPPPPSFDSMKFPPPMSMQQQLKQPPQFSAKSPEMVGHGMNSRVLMDDGTKPQPPEPPSFDFVEQQQQQLQQQQQQQQVVQPSAPSISPGTEEQHHVVENHLHGIMPVAAPPLGGIAQTQQADLPPPPPSFAIFESQQQQQQSSVEQSNNTEVAIDDDDVLAYDENGNPLSPEQRAALLEEQRKLYESIMKEKAANDAAIAQANADAFDMRSSNAAARAMSQGGTSLADNNRAMDSVGRDVTQPTTSTTAGTEGEQQTNAEEAARRDSRRMVKIGNNQMVALHGQDRTKKAIKEGTAILVQCINCQNWMQVTDTATLMFCPVCQVVSPVIQQTEVMTKEEAIQLTMDRKLAEKLQAEAYAQSESQGDSAKGTKKQQEEEGYMARFFGGIGEAVVGTFESDATGSGSASAAAQNERSDSWWDKISSIVSYGEPHTQERGELGVTRPPGAPASQYPAAAAAAAASRSPGTASNQNEETRGLLSQVVVDGNEANLPSARVGEANRPLFSCVTDSVNSAASALFHMGDDNNVNGVDSSSLLITNAGRGVGDGEGDYERLPDSERL